MKRTLFALALLLASLSTAMAQKEDSIYVDGMTVYDGFSEDILDKARVTVLEADSLTVLADSLRGDWWENMVNGMKVPYFAGFAGSVPAREVYVVKVTCEGYSPQLVRVKVPAKQYGAKTRRWQLPNVYLWREMNYDLGEATVKATKIKMVMHGDTLVYNAAAFQMAEGSMLDNLVRALPGVKLEDGGRITVNGEYVSSLLVNGRDFFKGDPQIALSNLPAYTVNKIKVYKERPKEEEGVERSEAERENDPLVMDVNLKREYAQGWIANVEAGGGSRLGDGFDPVWMGRLFALRYTNHSSLGIYANVNNMDDYQAPGSKGEWKRTEPGQGRRTTKMGGIDFSVDGKETGIEFHTTLQAMRQDITDEQRTSAEDYLPAAPSVFRSNRSTSRTGTTDLKWAADVFVPSFPNKIKKIGTFGVNTSAYYTRTTGDATHYSTQWEALAPTAGYTSSPDTVYERLLLSTSERKARGGKVGFNLRPIYELFGSRFAFNLGADASYDRRDYSSLADDRIDYFSALTPDVAEERSSVQPETDYAYHVRGGISNANIKWFPSVSYTYGQEFRSGHRDLSERNGREETGQAPSADAPGEWLLDQANSFHTTRMERSHLLDVRWYLGFFERQILRFNFGFPFTFTHRQICDFRNNSLNTTDSRDFKWEPSAGSTYYGKKLHVFFNYRFSQALPDLFYLLDIRDDSDPLYVSLGNSRLKTSQTHALSLDFKIIPKERQAQAYISTHYNKSNRLVALARFYDLTTGITSTRPENIDGNWDAGLSVDYSQVLGAKQRWTLQGEAGGTFLHSVDFATDNPSATLPDRVAVDNLSIDAMLRADYRFEKWTAGAKATVQHTRLTGGGPSFTPFHYTDAAFGLTLTAPLPGGIDLETDLMAYLRRGYTDASMNTTDWVWNASLSKAFGKRKQWLLRAVGFDILQQLSNIRRTVNAQGRTETWYNTTPAYASLHLTYRFDMKPKKRPGKK